MIEGKGKENCQGKKWGHVFQLSFAGDRATFYYALAQIKHLSARSVFLSRSPIFPFSPMNEIQSFSMGGRAYTGNTQRSTPKKEISCF